MPTYRPAATLLSTPYHVEILARKLKRKSQPKHPWCKKCSQESKKGHAEKL